METQKDTEKGRHGDGETRRWGEGETRRRGDTGTRRRGDTGTRRRGDTETRRSRCLRDGSTLSVHKAQVHSSVRRCLRVSVSPCLPFSVSPCLPFSVSPCLPFSVSPLLRVPVSPLLRVLPWLKEENEVQTVIIGFLRTARRCRGAAIIGALSAAKYFRGAVRRRHHRDRGVSHRRSVVPRLPPRDAAQSRHVGATGPRLRLSHLRHSLLFQRRLPSRRRGRGGAGARRAPARRTRPAGRTDPASSSAMPLEIALRERPLARCTWVIPPFPSDTASPAAINRRDRSSR